MPASMAEEQDKSEWPVDQDLLKPYDINGLDGGDDPVWRWLWWTLAVHEARRKV